LTSETARGQAGTSAATTETTARVVFAALVLACFAAFFLTQHLKHTPTALQSFKLTPFFSPTPSGHIKEEQISFKPARADEVTVTILDSSGAVVATLLRDLPVARYKQLSLRWNGRGGSAVGYASSVGRNRARILTVETRGKPAPEGDYRVRVHLREQDRTVLSPRSFRLVRP
jgi:hypothetical protein